ncbi:MAG: hypothetical protein BWY67_01837 [Bacteroidetes bacterium ADurb.Bin397]|nr:MAG: hypothetical protein BWY67_01837 [Bacteroidetes bacterium ADurb.Bin397]
MSRHTLVSPNQESICAGNPETVNGKHTIVLLSGIVPPDGVIKDWDLADGAMQIIAINKARIILNFIRQVFIPCKGIKKTIQITFLKREISNNAKK